MEKVRHLGTELACAFWCSALQQRYRNAPAQVLLRLVRQWNMPSCIAANMSSQFISILLEIFWILYCAQLCLIRTSNELLEHYPNTVGMQDPAMITLSLPNFAPRNNQVEPAEPKHLEILWNLGTWTWFCRSFIHDTVPGGWRQNTLDMPGCIMMNSWCTWI